MLTERGKEVRRKTLDLMLANGGYHFGGTFSCVEILYTLFDKVLKNDDIFILSKGHGCWAYYVLLMEKGFKPRIEGHPHRDVHNGIHWTTGSLGHGFPAGVGIALAKKIKKESGRVFVLMGDGECQEGTTWESLLLAEQYKLNNLTVIVDCNGLQGSGSVTDILDFKLPYITECVDGHNEFSLFNVLTYVPRHNLTVIQALTVKGYGVSFMENKAEWHAKFPTEKEIEQIRKELV